MTIGTIWSLSLSCEGRIVVTCMTRETDLREFMCFERENEEILEKLLQGVLSSDF